MLSSNRLVYKHTKSEFVEHIRTNQIVDKIQEGMYASGFGRASPAEVRSWQNSLQFMRNVLEDNSIPDDLGIGLEFNIPQTSKRIDVILTGFNDFNKNRSAVIVELKQWSNVDVTFKDGIVRTFLGGRER